MAKKKAKPDTTGSATFVSQAEGGIPGAFHLKADTGVFQATGQDTAATKPPPAPVPRFKLPAALPQQTAPEVKALTQFIANAQTGNGFKQPKGEVALVYSAPGSSLQVRCQPQPDSLDASIEALRLELEAAGGVQAVFVCLVAMALVAANDGDVDIRLDDLIRLVGRGDEARRSEEARAKVRRETWQSLRLAGCPIFGRRPGRPFKQNGKVIETEIAEALVNIEGIEWQRGTSLPPVRILLTATKWLRRFIDNRQILPDYGDLRKLAKLSTGQPSGEWALALGLALNQLWREESSYAEMTRPGGEERQSVKFRPFTRRELFDMCPPSPSPFDLLKSSNPERAIKYYNDAIKELCSKEINFIGYYKADKIETGNGRGAIGWRDEFLDQPQDIKPDKASQQDTIEILKKATKARKARTARRKARQAAKN